MMGIQNAHGGTTPSPFHVFAASLMTISLKVSTMPHFALGQRLPSHAFATPHHRLGDTIDQAHGFV
jgi:hypothetical protein